MRKNNVKNFVSGVEKKYRKVKSNLRQVDRRFLSKEESTELAYKINEIERYGFRFHPNVYVWDMVEDLNKMTKSLISKQEERQNG